MTREKTPQARPFAGPGTLSSLTGLLFILASAAIVARATLHAAGTAHLGEFRRDCLLVAALGAAMLAAGAALILYGRLKRESVEAGEIIEGALSRCADRPAWAGEGIREAARAAGECLDRVREERSAVLDAIGRVQERRLEFLAKAYSDLLSHHRVTKRMFRCSRVSEVYENLLQGIREGLGFREVLIGYKEPEGDLVFAERAGPQGPPEVRVPVWDERSVLARAVWYGDPIYVPPSADEGRPEADRRIFGEGSAFLVPVIVKGGLPRADLGACWRADDAPAAGAEERDRCWILRAGGAGEAGGAARMECARCDRFPGTALLVVRTCADGRPLLPDRTKSIVTLAHEASLALEVVGLHEGARKMSITDGLTGLANHREFFNALGRELERARRYQRTVSLLMIDLDDFKRVNDRFGHLAGDAVLRRVADLLRGCARATDIVARYGGEEFGIIMPESTPSGALMLAERIKTEIANHDFLPHVPGGVRLTASVGIFSTEDGAVSEDQVVRFADEAAYQAKSAGKNRVVVRTHA